jgi:hypothetical protein
MSNNCIIAPVVTIGITKNGADALGGTFDPAWSSSGVTYSSDLLTANIGGSRAAGSINHITSGKKYFEMTIIDWTGRYGPIIGVTPGGNYTDPGAISLWVVDGGSTSLFDSGTQVGTFSVVFGLNDTLGVLVDMDAKSVAFFKNGAPTGITRTITATDVKAFVTSSGSSYPTKINANFGSNAFK